MKAKADNIKAVKLQLTDDLYQRVAKTAQAAGCEVGEVILSTLETGLPLLPEHLPPALATDLARLSWLDDAALQAIANAFLPAQKQRRFTTLLRKAEAGQLSAREQAEWETLQQDYLRVSQNKAKAMFLLAQRDQARQINGAAV